MNPFERQLLLKDDRPMGELRGVGALPQQRVSVSDFERPRLRYPEAKLTCDHGLTYRMCRLCIDQVTECLEDSARGS